MAIRTGINAPAHLVDKYINTAYDNVKLVADNIGSVNTIAGISSEVEELGRNADEIVANLESINFFSDVYIGASATDPATRTDGSPLQDGDMYFNTDTDNLMVYSTDTGWVSAVFLAKTDTTSFISNGSTLAYNIGSDASITETNVDIYFDGVYQSKSNFTVANGILTLSQAPEINTVIDVKISNIIQLHELFNQDLYYLGAKSADPTVRNDGSPLQEGDLYYNTVVQEAYVYTGLVWVKLVQSVINTQNNFVGDGATTAFTLSVSVDNELYVSVFIDGIYQEKNAYSVAGTTLTFTGAPPVNASIEVITSNNIPISGSSEAITFTSTITGTVNRPLNERLVETMSVKDFGAVGDWTGTQSLSGIGTDDTAAIQAAVDYCLANGVRLYFPKGRYRTTATITIDHASFGEEDSINGNMTGFSICGASAASAQIIADHNGTAVKYIGGDGTAGADWHTYFQWDGVGITKAAYDQAVGSKGLQIDQMAYGSITRFYIYGFEYGLYCEDVLSSTFNTGTLLGNEYGYLFQKNQRSNPNNINFSGIVVQGNNTYGGYIVKPHLFNIDGGSIESNGIGNPVMDANSWGLFVQNSGNEGAVGLVMDGCYIEGNNGRADVWIQQQDVAGYNAVHHIKGTSFFRFTESKFTQNQIYWDAAANRDNKLILNGCGFVDYNPYAAAYKNTYVATASQTVFVYTFTAPSGDTSADYSVWQNGALLELTTDYTIDTGTKTVTLNIGATLNDNIVIIAKGYYVSEGVVRKHIGGSDHTILDAGNNLLLDYDNGNSAISRSLWSPLGVNSQVAYASLPDPLKYRNGIKYCQDGSGGSFPALAVSDGVNWWQMPLGQFSGAVQSTGTANHLPRGWSSAKPFTGVYTITHNLNTDAGVTTEYAVTVTPRGSSGTGVCTGMVKSGDSVELYMTNLSGTATDMDFDFTLTII